jgi:hypothetical protein
MNIRWFEETVTDIIRNTVNIPKAAVAAIEITLKQ